MSNPHIEENWVIKLQCKECSLFKKLSDFYKHNDWYLWVLWRCKECIKEWRKWKYERWMAIVRDRNRYRNNIKRRLYTIYYMVMNKLKMLWHKKE